MKTLETACKNILSSAEETTKSPAVLPSSSTKSGGLMVMTASQLVQKTPEENDKSLYHYLTHTLNLPISIEVESRFSDNGWYPVHRVKIDGMTHAQKLLALQAIKDFNAPLPAEEIIKLMYRLELITNSGKEKNDIDKKMRAAVWVEELSQYPADIVTKALKAKYRWFPSLAEIMDKCEDIMAYRKLLQQGIRFYYSDEDDNSVN